MRDKNICLKCRFRTRVGGDTSMRSITIHNVGCYYSAYSGRTCTRVVDGKVVDIRGDGPNCNVFEEGDPQPSLQVQF